MTTATDRATSLREDIAEAEYQMGVHRDDWLYGMYATKASNARAELAEVEGR
jgi:hypothetical protein